MTVWGVSLFADLSVERLALLVVLYFLAFVVKGIFGLGAQPPLVIFGAMIVNPHDAVLLAVVSNAISHVQFIPESVRHGDWKAVRPLIVGYVPSTALGVWLFGHLNSASLTLVLGAALTAVILAEGYSLFRRWEKPIRDHPSIVGSTIAGVSGLVGGLTGAGGVVLTSLYIKMLCTEARTFRATILLVATIVMVWRMLVLAASGFVDLSLFAECLVLVPFSVLGGFLGSRLFGKIPRDRFFWAFRLVLVAAALNLVFKGVRNLMG